MSYKLTLIQKAGYLHAAVAGENSKETVARYLEEVLRECVARNCHRLLIEERLAGPRLGTTSVFEIAAEGSDHAQGHFNAIAYVDVNAEGTRMEFAETVAVNRGLPVRVFPSVVDAENWLLGKG
jgi:hypothetical protein